MNCGGSRTQRSPLIAAAPLGPSQEGGCSLSTIWLRLSTRDGNTSSYCRVTLSERINLLQVLISSSMQSPLRAVRRIGVRHIVHSAWPTVDTEMAGTMIIHRHGGRQESVFDLGASEVASLYGVRGPQGAEVQAEKRHTGA